MGSIELLVCAFGICVMMGALMIITSIRIVPEKQRLSVYRLGRYIGEKGPGLVLLIPVIDKGVMKEFNPQEKTPSQ